MNNILINPITPYKYTIYHNDHLGTPNELTNNQGEVVWLADYEAWGNTAKVIWHEVELQQIQIAKDELQPIRFQGQTIDQETGLHYNRFRYYDPDVGMFISRDPIGLMGGNNIFQYAPNPTGWVDPWGLKGVTVTPAPDNSAFDFILEIDSSVYPETAGHIKEAINNGHADIVTIDRPNAKSQRKDSLKGCPCTPGKDRDEWPMAMFKEGGTGASIMHIDPSDNRGAGSSISHALKGIPNDATIKFTVK